LRRTRPKLEKGYIGTGLQLRWESLNDSSSGFMHTTPAGSSGLKREETIVKLAFDGSNRSVFPLCFSPGKRFFGKERIH